MKKRLGNFVAWHLRKTQFRITIRLTRHKLARCQHLFMGDLLDIGAGDQPYRELFGHIKSYTGTNTKEHYSKDELSGIEKFTDVWIKDGTRLPFGSSTFDGVVSFQVMSVIEKPDLFFKEMSRLLKIGGLLLVTTDFLYPKWAPADLMRHTDVHLRKLSENNGFEVIRLESYGAFWTMIYNMLIRYIRSYPAAWKTKKRGPKKILCGILYVPVLILQPALSLVGSWIYLAEKNVTTGFDYSANSILLAKKIRSIP
jgi:SAM-dependent methyltransferase